MILNHESLSGLIGMTARSKEPCASKQREVVDRGEVESRREPWVFHNRAGDEAGTMLEGNRRVVAYIRKNGGRREPLGPPGNSGSVALGLSEQGKVVGFAETESEQIQAFLFDERFTMLGTLGGNWSEARAVADSGIVAGRSANAEGRGVPFLYTKGGMKDLQLLGSADSGSAMGIQGDGRRLVGWCGGNRDVLRATLWDSDGRPHDLNDLISPENGWVLLCASMIRGDGAIEGVGWVSGRGMRKFLLT